MGLSIRSSRSTALGCAGKIGAAIFFTIFLLFGIGFTVGLAWDLLATLRTWSWEEVPCTILDSRGRNVGGEEPYVFDVAYRYEYQGSSYEGTGYRRRQFDTGDYSDIQRLLDRYPSDSQATCRVNPDEPSEAVLETEAAWQAPFLLLPLLFVIIGGGGLYFTFRSNPPQPLSSTSGSRPMGPRAQMGFFGVFLLVGLALAGVFGTWAYRAISAQSWPAVPCVVISSTVRSHSGDDGTTYSIDILYRYEFDDHGYSSNRYSVIGGSSSGYTGKQAIASRYRPGSHTVCYVNPGNPSYAILHRGWSWQMLLFLFPLPFIAVGAGGIITSVRKARAPDAAAPSATAINHASSPRAKFLFMLFFALFWNGIIAIFIFEAVQSWRRGDPDYFLSCFMIPFVLIGLGAIGAVFHSLLALFNPALTVVLNRSEIPLGESTQIQWEFTGRIDRIDRLRITLEGTERATFDTTSNGRRSSSTTSRRFAELAVFETRSPPSIERGTTTLHVPPDTMHSFDSGSNRIAWKLVVRGEIPHWPDVRYEQEITVLPMPLPQEVVR